MIEISCLSNIVSCKYMIIVDKKEDRSAQGQQEKAKLISVFMKKYIY